MAAERREKGEREGAAPPHTTHAHTQFREGEVRERKVREEGEDHTVAITHPHHSYTAAHTGIEETKPSSPPSLSVPHRPMHHNHWISSQLHTHPSTKDQTSSSPPIVCSAAMTQRIRPLLLVLFFLAMVSNSVVVCTSRHQYWRPSDGPEGASYCLSWRVAVEANNVRAWRTVPTQCLRHVESYMIGGQYDRDINFIIDHVISYLDGVDLSNDGLDAWILDVDDTCISNLIYYKGKRFGCDPYDPDGFKTWALRGGCPAIPGVLRLFNKLIGNGFKVFLVTGRDESTFGQATLDNLQNQGFIGYQRLILRNLGGVVIEVGFCLKILLKEICTSYNSNFPISHAS